MAKQNTKLLFYILIELKLRNNNIRLLDVLNSVL